MAADIGTLARLPKIVGSTSWVKDVCLTARNFSAEEALGVGFVSRVLVGKTEAVGKAVEMAAILGSKSPVAVQGTKELLNHARDHSVKESKWTYLGNWRMGVSDVNVLTRSTLYGRLECGHDPVDGFQGGADGCHVEEEADVREVVMG